MQNFQVIPYNHFTLKQCTWFTILSLSLSLSVFLSVAWHLFVKSYHDKDKHFFSDVIQFGNNYLCWKTRIIANGVAKKCRRNAYNFCFFSIDDSCSTYFTPSSPYHFSGLLRFAIFVQGVLGMNSFHLFFLKISVPIPVLAFLTGLIFPLRLKFSISSDITSLSSFLSLIFFFETTVLLSVK